MTQCNIPEARRYDREWKDAEERELLKTQLRLRDERIEELVGHIESITNRVKSGHTVWIDYRSGDRLYLKAYTTEPPQGIEPGPWEPKPINET